MLEEQKSALSSDVKMQQKSAVTENVSLKNGAAAQDNQESNQNLPNSTSNIEEDWRRLK